MNHATVQEVLENELKYKREEVIAKEAALAAERKAKDEALAAERKAKDEAVAKQHKLELEQQRNGPRLERLHLRITFGARLASACLEGHFMPL